MNNENTVYELLQNAPVAEKVLESVKVTNFWVAEFMTDEAMINGDTAEYYSSNPAAGTKYKSPRKIGGMKWDNDKIYKCSVPVLVDEIFQTKITKDMLRIATGSPEKAEMIAALQANNLRKKLDIRIMEKCVEAVCKKENFSQEAYVEMNEKDFNDPGKFLKTLFTIAEKMKHPTDSYNKGFKKKNGEYEKTIYASGKLKDMVVILNTEKKTDLRLEGSKTYNYSLVDLEREFKSVHDAILPENAGALIMSQESFVLNWQIKPELIIQDHESDPLTKKVSLPGFIVGGPISFANMAIVVNGGKKVPLKNEEKDILANYGELGDEHAYMQKDSAKKWKDLGFNFEQTKEWLDAGLKVTDHEFANWLKTEKYDSVEKFLNSGDDIDTLREAFDKKDAE